MSCATGRVTEREEQNGRGASHRAKVFEMCILYYDDLVPIICEVFHEDVERRWLTPRGEGVNGNNTRALKSKANSEGQTVQSQGSCIFGAAF